MVYITNFANKDMNTKQTDLERAKSQIFSDIAGCLNSTNNEYWITVIERAEDIIHVAKQLKDMEIQ